MSRTAAAMLFACAAASACRQRDEKKVTVVVALSASERWDASTLRVRPPRAELARTRNGQEIALELAQSAGRVVLDAAGACPRALDLASAAAGSTLRSSLDPLFELGPNDRVVGADASFEIRALPRCAEAARARVSIAVRGGAALTSAGLSDDGRTFSGHTQGFSGHLVGGSFGIVPVSDAQRLVSELAVVVEGPRAKSVSYALRVAALARGSGLPNVAIGHPVLLAGAGLTLQAASGSNAALRDVGGLQAFVPDVRGSYLVSDSAGHELMIESARYDQVPLDCGRSDCHHAIAESSRNSPMTRALAADLGGCHPLSEPSCALRCHTTGEPGTNDGGFAQVARELGEQALPGEYSALPRALHRVGGVGCLACHGPSAIPKPLESWALLRPQVCAVCHDAPPRYGHAAALASSRMASADRDPRVRKSASCAACHTTWGALADATRKPPLEAGSFGIGCAACHDVHPHAPGAAPASEPVPSLLRALPFASALRDTPASFDGVSRVCVPCHAPTEHAVLPEASAAAIVAGRGGLSPESGEPLNGSAPHARDTKGCLSCHDSGPPGLERGAGHAFRASGQQCAACHEQKVVSDVRERALELRAKLAGAPLDPASGPSHATLSAPRSPSIRVRALYDVELVLEDPAAATHNPAYAKLLLDAAQPFASTSARGGKP